MWAKKWFSVGGREHFALQGTCGSVWRLSHNRKGTLLASSMQGPTSYNTQGSPPACSRWRTVLSKMLTVLRLRNPDIKQHEGEGALKLENTSKYIFFSVDLFFSVPHVSLTWREPQEHNTSPLHPLTNDSFRMGGTTVEFGSRNWACAAIPSSPLPRGDCTSALLPAMRKGPCPSWEGRPLVFQCFQGCLKLVRQTIVFTLDYWLLSVSIMLVRFMEVLHGTAVWAFPLL